MVQHFNLKCCTVITTLKLGGYASWLDKVGWYGESRRLQIVCPIEPLAFFPVSVPASRFIASHLVETNVCTTARNSCHHHYCPCQSDKLMTSPPTLLHYSPALLCPSLWLIELCHCQAPLGYFCQDAKSRGYVSAQSPCFYFRRRMLFILSPPFKPNSLFIHFIYPFIYLFIYFGSFVFCCVVLSIMKGINKGNKCCN